MQYTSALTPSLSHRMGEGAQRAGEGAGALHPVDCAVSEIFRPSKARNGNVVARESALFSWFTVFSACSSLVAMQKVARAIPMDFKGCE
jgi:hypothetical protein